MDLFWDELFAVHFLVGGTIKEHDWESYVIYKNEMLPDGWIGIKSYCNYLEPWFTATTRWAPTSYK